MAGASRTKGAVVPYDRTKHLPTLHRVTWETLSDYDGGRVTQVRELGTSNEDGGPPDFPSEALEAEEHAAMSKQVPEPSSRVPRKLLYAEALAAGRPDLTGAEYRLLMAMWKYANNSTLGDIFPGHTRLAEQVGLSGKSGRDKVRARIGSLIRKGYVIKLRDGSSVSTRRAAEYRLTLPEWEQGSPS